MKTIYIKIETLQLGASGLGLSPPTEEIDKKARLIIMEKTTQKELRDGIRLGIYTLVNGDNIDKYKGHDIEQIRYCSGTYGINGALYIDHTNKGELLAVPCRSSVLFTLS